jgi:hypothetical protein
MVIENLVKNNKLGNVIEQLSSGHLKWSLIMQES